MTRKMLPLFIPYSLVIGLAGAILPACAGEADSDLGADSDGTDGGSDGDSDGGTTGDEDPDGGSDGGSTGGDDPDGDPDGGTSGGSGDPVDDTPPQVIAMSPADGEAGVLADAQIVVTFSEPMDKAATQQAYQSADIPVGTMEWNADGDVLTITPADYLEWSFVESPDDPAIEYTYMISSLARDLAGNEMLLEEEATFTTMRGQNIMITVDPQLSGSVSKAGNHAIPVESLPLATGDTADNDRVAILVTFDFSVIPEETVGLAGAVLQGLQETASGSPYFDLGDLTLQEVSYDALTPAAETIPSVHDYGTVSTGPSPALMEVDVSGEVIARWDAGDPSMQFRLRHETATDGSGDEDLTILGGPGAVLWVTAAYP